MIKTFIIIFAILGICVSDTHWGKCPAVHYELETFDLESYLGTWYEIVRSKAMPWEFGECVQAKYSLNEKGNVRVENSQVVDNVRQKAFGEAVKTDNPFRLEVTFSENWVSKLFKGDYQIVNTDYKEFSLVYSCSSFLVARTEFVWILSRTPSLDKERLDNFLHYIENNFGFKRDSLHFTDQEKGFCAY